MTVSDSVSGPCALCRPTCRRPTQCVQAAEPRALPAVRSAARWSSGLHTNALMIVRASCRETSVPR